MGGRPLPHALLGGAPRPLGRRPRGAGHRRGQRHRRALAEPGRGGALGERRPATGCASSPAGARRPRTITARRRRSSTCWRAAGCRGGRARRTRCAPGDCLVYRPSCGAHTLIAGDGPMDVLAFGERRPGRALPSAAGGGAVGGPVLGRGRRGGGRAVGARGGSRPARDARARSRRARPGSSIATTSRACGRSGRGGAIARAGSASPPAASPPGSGTSRSRPGRAGIRATATAPRRSCSSSSAAPARCAWATRRPRCAPATCSRGRPGRRSRIRSTPGRRGSSASPTGSATPTTSCYYPDSGKVSFAGVGVIGRIEPLDYWDGEDLPAPQKLRRMGAAGRCARRSRRRGGRRPAAPGRGPRLPPRRAASRAPRASRPARCGGRCARGARIADALATPRAARARRRGLRLGGDRRALARRPAVRARRLARRAPRGALAPAPAGLARRPGQVARARRRPRADRDDRAGRRRCAPGRTAGGSR